uniref:Uncharacterized protein n=1 Tax=Chlorobium phaeobacteroides (strain BS1) TaxID=331678 RepID=B3ELT0_CHLPB
MKLNDGGIRLMFEDMIPQVEEAVKISRSWANNGWSMGFGPKSAEVNSLEAAEALPVSFIYREDAVNYWHQVELLGNDAADSGEKAISAMRSGDATAVENALYLSQYIEKPLAGKTSTWKSLYEALKEKTAECA